MIHETVVVGPLQCNCAVLGCEKTKEAVLIDPGDEPAKIIAEVEKQGLKVKFLLHTHAHFDHIAGTKGCKEHLGATICLQQEDDMLYQNLAMQGQMFGMTFEPTLPVEKYIEDGEEIVFGEHTLEVLHTPGHSPGSVAFRLKDGDERVFSGDTLFLQSVGRSDLWGGNHSLLIRSIKSRLLVLDDEIRVYPGHGPSTSVGWEKRKNPFLN